MSTKARRPPPVATSFVDKLGIPSAASMSRQTSTSSHTSTTAEVNPRHASSAYPAPPSASMQNTDSWIIELREEIREREKPNLDRRLAEVEEKRREARTKIERDPHDLENRLLRLEDYTLRKRNEVIEQFRMIEEDEVNLAKALRASSGEGDVNLEEDEDVVRTQKEILEQIARDAQQKAEQANRVDASPTASSYPHPSVGVAPQARRIPSTQSVMSKRSLESAMPRRGSTSDSLTSDPYPSSRGTNDSWEHETPYIFEEDGLDPVNEEHSDTALEDYANYKRGDRSNHDDGSDSDEDYGYADGDNGEGEHLASAYTHHAEQVPQKSSARVISGENVQRSRAASIGKTPPFAQVMPTLVRHQSSRGNLNQIGHQVWKHPSVDQMRGGVSVPSRPIPIPSQQPSQTAGFPKRQPSMNMTELQGRQRQGSRDADTLWQSHDDVRARARSGSTSGGGATGLSASALPGTSASPRSSSASGAAGQAQFTTPRRWTPGETPQRTPAPPVSSNVHANGGGASPAGVYRQRNNSETSSGVGGRSMSPARRPSLSNVHSQAPHTPSPKPTSSMAIPGSSGARRVLAESPPTTSTSPVNIPVRATAGSRASASSIPSSSLMNPPPSSSLGTSQGNGSASPPLRFVMIEPRHTELLEPEPFNIATGSLPFGLSTGKGKSPAFNMRATGRKEEDWEAGAKSAGQRTPNGSRPPSALSGRMAQEKEKEAAKGKEKEVTVPEDREEDEDEEASKVQSQTKATSMKMKGRKRSGQGDPVPTITAQAQPEKMVSQSPAPEDITPLASAAQAQLISDLETRIVVLNAEIAALHISHASERRNLEESTTALRTSLESQLASMTSARTQVEADLSSKLASVTSAKTEAEAKISTLLAQIDEKKEKEKEREKKLKEDAVALKKVHKELEKAHKELEKAHKELEHAKEREVEARKEIEDQKRLRKDVEEQRKLRKEAEEKVKRVEEERRKANEEILKLRQKAEDAEMRASEEVVKRQEETVKRESEDAERRTREEMEKKQRVVEEKKADLERRKKEKEVENLRREIEEREAAMKRIEESLARREESLDRREESLDRKEEEWANRLEEEEGRRAAEEEERKRREEATTEEDDDDDDDDEDADAEGDDGEAERAEAARLEAQKSEELERARRLKVERERERVSQRIEHRKRELQREVEENREREEKTRREKEDTDRIRRHEREQRERTSRRHEPTPPQPLPSQTFVDEADVLPMDDSDIEAQRRALHYYDMQKQRNNLKDAKSSSAGAAYAKGWNNTEFPGRATTASSSAPSNVSQRSTASNTSNSTAASDFSRASGTSSATSWSGTSSSGGTARATPPHKSSGSWKPPPTASSNGAYGAGMGMGASPGSYTNSSPLSDAEWARRQEENARRQQEAFIRENIRMEQEKAARAAAAAMNASGGRAAVAQLWAQYESAWATLKDRPALFFGTVPWPVLKAPTDPDELTANAISAFVLSTAHSQGKSNRDRIKEQLMRWHPDKFESRWMGKVVEAEKDIVRCGAGMVVRGLNELMARE